MSKVYFLYHYIPENQQGNILYPLNVLKHKYPDVYAKQVGKYEGREFVMQNRIPILDCLWNDVLHFSAVHPRQIKQALIDAGSASGKDLKYKDFSMECYQVDPKLLEPENTVVYLYAQKDSEDKMNRQNFVKYKSDELAKYSVIPEGTKQYYKQVLAEGKRPLLYHRIPHILYRGELNTQNLPIIDVQYDKIHK